ncbi:MAG: L,D-transpeptidase family protein [Alphaproteobacteria bacterium]|nr:L,D-transpeptidase family protein [Alphaproteobacteria bacterium]
MTLIVIPDRADSTRGRLSFGDNSYECVLGRGGISDAKSEGDGTTPCGSFILRRVLYRADRGEAPITTLPIAAIEPRDGWCDAPDDPQYNLPVEHPYGASAEELWRDDNRYDVLVILGHNDDPVVPGAGSAIFLHVAADDFRPTEGCVAMRCDDLLVVLKNCTPDSVIDIRPVTES